MVSARNSRTISLCSTPWMFLSTGLGAIVVFWVDLRQQSKSANRRVKSASCPSALQLTAELMGNLVASPHVPSPPAQGSRKSWEERYLRTTGTQRGRMSQPVLFLPQPQTEQVGGVYQCGHLVKGVDQELKVQFTLMGRGGGSSREIELDCVCLFAGVRAGGPQARV